MSKTKIPCSELPWGQLPSPPPPGLSSHFSFSAVPCRNVSWDESEQDFQATVLLPLAPTNSGQKCLCWGLAATFTHFEGSLWFTHPLILFISESEDHQKHEVDKHLWEVVLSSLLLQASRVDQVARGRGQLNCWKSPRDTTETLKPFSAWPPLLGKFQIFLPCPHVWSVPVSQLAHALCQSIESCRPSRDV